MPVMTLKDDYMVFRLKEGERFGEIGIERKRETERKRERKREREREGEKNRDVFRYLLTIGFFLCFEMEYLNCETLLAHCLDLSENA